jgi:hypothetical protein
MKISLGLLKDFPLPGCLDRIEPQLNHEHRAPSLILLSSNNLRVNPCSSAFSASHSSHLQPSTINYDHSSLLPLDILPPPRIIRPIRTRRDEYPRNGPANCRSVQGSPPFGEIPSAQSPSQGYANCCRKRDGFARYRDPEAVLRGGKSRWHHETPPRPAHGPGAYSIPALEVQHARHQSHPRKTRPRPQGIA